MSNEVLRKIIHIDMDAFFAAVEQRDFPQYRGLPLVVGSRTPRSVVAAASYEARQFGIFSAMPMWQALERCPQLIVARPRFEAYRQVSEQIRGIFTEYTSMVEPLSLDEAFLDVTKNKPGIASASIIAKDIRQRIYQKTGLTASAGVSINKFIAKVASGINKPNGQTVITPEQAQSFICNLPIEKFYGVGRVTAQKMRNLGINSGADLLKWTQPALEAQFGKTGAHYFNIVRNQDFRPVNPHRDRHSVGIEETFDKDIYSPEVMLFELERMADELLKRTNKNNFAGKTITLKIRLSNFKIITRSLTMPQSISTKEEVLNLTKYLLSKTALPQGQGSRLLGLAISNAVSNSRTQQLELPLFN